MKLFTVTDAIHINAPIERCFLLSTSVDLVAQVLRMQPISGKTSGLVHLNDQILWRGWKFGLPQIHKSRITAYDRPRHFQDTMVRGRFKHFHHDHNFTEIDGHTLLHDRVRFSLPLGPLGSLVARYVMIRYIRHLLRLRLKALKIVAESDRWAVYLGEESS